jgi:hypothetical protein
MLVKNVIGTVKAYACTVSLYIQTAYALDGLTCEVFEMQQKARQYANLA